MDARLRFATIHIYEFAPIIGDNPFVSRGVPIAMGHQVQELVMLLERYELERGPRRTRRQLMIHRKVRQAILLDEGFAQEDIDEAARTAREVRKSIVESCSKKYWDRINERLEATSRVIAKAVVERVRRVRKEDSLCQWNVANMERLNRGNLVTLIKGELAKDDTNANDESNATDVAVETPLQCNNRIVSAKTESLHQNIAKLESLNRGGFQMSMPIAIRKQQRSASTA